MRLASARALVNWMAHQPGILANGLFILSIKVIAQHKTRTVEHDEPLKEIIAYYDLVRSGDRTPPLTATELRAAGAVEATTRTGTNATLAFRSRRSL